jgi:hypothetical protein
MFSKVARGAFLLILAVMIVSWAISVGKSSPVEPQNDQPVEQWNLYS